MAVKISIHQQLLESLRQRTAALPVGSRFPTEHELCAEFGVSRATINKVMVKLTEDGVLTRTPRKGSFVMRAVKPQVPITFLLPCADFISDATEISYSLHTRQVLKGVSQVAFEHNRRVQTVPVSPTNNKHDIDWNQLEFVDKNSLVMLLSYWYCDLFPLFKERGCRTVLVENQTYHSKVYADYLKEWFVLSMDSISATAAAVEFLAERGCRRIAVIHNDIEEKNHPVLKGYKAGLLKCGLKYAAWLDTLNTASEAIAGAIADFYKKNNFDALLLDPYLVFRLRTQHSLNYCLGLPERVKIMASDEISYNRRAFPSLSSTEFPYEEIGRIAAQCLLNDEFKPGRQFFSARIIERESTMSEIKHLALTT